MERHSQKNAKKKKKQNHSVRRVCFNSNGGFSRCIRKNLKRLSSQENRGSNLEPFAVDWIETTTPSLWALLEILFLQNLLLTSRTRRKWSSTKDSRPWLQRLWM
ncbi:hypothetical protein PanWU01x14_212550 [Parasponia andersonii]|uniref:Uncharacterized protein n=1 Tax=Parasponia andersonii TaxID=3476 RepID=A0A2P5BT79_PARAD|nr:hypothetical protein PanWU01x14_212550 [Parasponia andersonii]